MDNFCTLFDSRYMSRGLALYRSLERTGSPFHLYIFPFDDVCERVLRALSLPHASIVPLGEFEDAELRSVKGDRTRAEYCWTATSSTILYVLDTFGVPSCTYLDADLMFFASPRPLFEEMGDDSVMITEHRYTPRYDKSALSGIYCVQFVTFRNDERGRTALTWWRQRCLEWCYARHEDGKFGDQKYLDDWTERFRGVHVLQHLGGGMAAWNIQQYEVFEREGVLWGREASTGTEFQAIFYHYHYVRFLTGDRIDLGRRLLSSSVRQLLYVPYIRRLQEAAREIRQVDDRVDPHGTTGDVPLWKRPAIFLYRKALGVYNIFPSQEFA